jgi:hypothetical protein
VNGTYGTMDDIEAAFVAFTRPYWIKLEGQGEPKD